jgi:Arc/MetJ-type ribon-helix-helix transcriptional regulator
MAKFTISLPESLRGYVEAQVAAKGFKSVADYISFVVCMDKVQNAEPSMEDELLDRLQSESGPVSDADVQRIKHEIYDRRLKELRRELETGIEEPGRGNSRTYDAGSTQQLLDDIKAQGRKRLAERRSGVGR